jgi:transcriptional antiterminator RfaH
MDKQALLIGGPANGLTVNADKESIALPLDETLKATPIIARNMPILPYEPDIYPDTLLDSPPPDAKWWAGYTFARREKVFMNLLRKFKVPNYGPLIKKTSRTPAGRVETSFIPLFSGYVFLCGNDDQRAEAFRTKCAVRIVEASDQAELLFDLRQIQRLIASDAPLTPESRLTKGMKVRIQSGPLSGIEGEVIKRRRKDTLLVAVRFLQQGASALLGDFEMERIG